MSSNFSLEFETTWNFSTKSVVPFGVKLQYPDPYTLSWVLPNLDFEYILIRMQSVYFILELNALSDFECY